MFWWSYNGKLATNISGLLGLVSLNLLLVLAYLVMFFGLLV